MTATVSTAEEIRTKESARLSQNLAALGLALGLAAEVLFYGHPPGISVPIWALLCVAALLLAARSHAVRPARPGAWMAAPILFFAIMPFLRQEGLSITLSGAAMVGCCSCGCAPFRQATCSPSAGPIWR